MRLVIVTSRLPYPPESGSDLRNWALLSRLARRHDVALVTRHASLDVPSALQERCADVSVARADPAGILRRVAAFVRGWPDLLVRVESPRFDDAVVGLVGAHAPDVVLFQGLDTTGAVERLRRTSPSIALVYDAHNVEHLMQARSRDVALARPAQWPLALWSHVQARRLRAAERRVCTTVDQMTCTSTIDATRLEELSTTPAPVVVPNGVETEARASEAAPDTMDVVFTGTFDYRPNRDAVEWLVRDIFPRVRRVVPAARLIVVGPNPPDWLEALDSSNGVVATGRVADARAIVAGAAVSVAPLRVGSGTRLKVLEALAVGVPVVSTRLGVEGLDLLEGRDFVAADAPGPFADAIVRLLNDGVERATLAAAGRAAVARYDWDRLVPQMEAALEAARSRAAQRIARTA